MRDFTRGEPQSDDMTLGARGARVHLANVQPQIEKVLDIVKALPGFSVFRNTRELDEYLAAMQKKVTEGE